MRIPVSTYRLQFNPQFTFADCRGIVQYLSDLGVTDVYASPVFKARKGSAHGYDIVDHNRINPELGSEGEFRELVAAFRGASMGWIQDIVPNHMAFDSENSILMDVLENGAHSRYFSYFDIEWDHLFGSIKGRVLVPLLGRFYSETLENGEIGLAYDPKGLTIRYYDLALPLKLKSYRTVFGRNINDLEARHADNPDFISFLGALQIFESLSAMDTTSHRYDQIKHAKRILWDFYNHNPVIKEFMDANIAYFNGANGDPASFNPLDELLSEQSFRLSFWKVATEEINYRRFFTINELISLRIEDAGVMDHAHRLVYALSTEGVLSGLRVDHIDGLYDPAEYLRRIKASTGGSYVVVEKILSRNECLRESWQAEGTTGYDFMSVSTGLFCDSESAREFDKIYARFAGERTGFDDLVAEKKRLIIGKYMAGNIDNLANLLKRISENDRYGRDITMYGLRRALVELAAFFPVYRTYIDSCGITDVDLRYIDAAHAMAARKSPGLMYEMNFIRKFLIFPPEDADPLARKCLLDFVMRFQQFTAPIMAKGFEDTVLYVYNRLISLNEVGGCPERFGTPLDEYHDFCARRQEHTPYTFNATATHDTKRGEDVRARINVLSELPKEWRQHLFSWSLMNNSRKTAYDGRFAPDPNDEYFLYQTLLGAFPFETEKREEFCGRMKRYIVKAVREAKVHTAWIKHDVEYEDGCVRFIDSLLDPSPDNAFLRDFLGFQGKVAFYGVFNSLAQVLLRCTSPGVADTYQGTELWDFCLVDPDNRSTVDFAGRREMLAGILKHAGETGYVRQLLESYHTGAVKLFTVFACLQARKRAPDLFLKGGYIPLRAEGRFARNVIAYCRAYSGQWALVAAPRFLTGVIAEGVHPLGEVWQDTRVVLPQGAPQAWRDVFAGGEHVQDGALHMSELFRGFPLCLMLSGTG